MKDMDCFGKFELGEIQKIGYALSERAHKHYQDSMALMNCQLTDEERDELRFQAERENITRKVIQQEMRKSFKMVMSLGLSKDRAIEELAKSHDLTTEEVEEYLVI